MKIIVKAALSNNKKNKTRSRLIMSAVFLSTLLLTVICTFAYGMIKTQKANAASDYGSHYGVLLNVTAQELQEIKRHSEFSEIGLMANAGMMDSKDTVLCVTEDEKTRAFTNVSLQLADGSFPEAEEEIAAQQEFFSAMGYENVSVGDRVMLNYRPDLKQKYETKEFTVSGIINPASTADYEIQQTSYMVFLSQAFYEAQYAPELRRYSVSFRLADYVQITYDDAQEVMEEIAAACGIEEKRVSVNTLYLMFTLDPGAETISICAVIALVVILFSVIVIYNIFQVSIVQNIREYGKICALGATKKQMRKLICYEGLFLAAGSIPAGIAAGYIISWGSFQWLMEQGSTVNSGIEHVKVNIFSLPVLLLAAMLAFFTVILALRKPMKIVASISPVDAIRYMESTGSTKAGIRKGKKRVSVWTMASANISANKKRTVMTVFTMGLSCVLFVVLANCVGNMDAEYDARKQVEYGQFRIELDYTMEDEAYPENNLDAVLADNPLNDNLMEQIQQISGVTQVWSRDILYLQVNGRKQSAAVYDEEDFNREKEEGGILGELDYHESEEDDVFYCGWSHFIEEMGYSIGQAFTAELANGRDTCSVNGVMKGAFGSSDTDIIITKQMYERLGWKDRSIGWLWIDCQEQDAGRVRGELENLMNGMEHVEMSAYKDELRMSELGVRTMKLSCYLFLAVIGLIGFMNLANTMVMNIITKKQEYGILQAAGMTNRQLNYSLQIQGLIFSAGTVLIAVLVGLPAGYGIFCYGKSQAVFGLNVYHVPAAELICMAAAIALLQIGLSYVLSRNLKKESLVERIRYQE